MTDWLRPDIGLVGRKRVGKDTAARHLARAYDYRPLAFADPLREAVEALDPIVDTVAGEFFRYRTAVALVGYEAAKETFPEVRRVLQNFGLGLRKTLGEDVWVDALLQRLPLLNAMVPAVVTDVRFENEVDALRARGFVLVRIVRDTGLEADPHPSETAIDSLFVHHEVENDGSLEDLHAALDRIVAEHSL